MKSTMHSKSMFASRHRWRAYPLYTLFLGIVAVAALTLANAQPLLASDFRGGDTITIGEGEVIDDDLFISGDRVTINGTVKGNLFASGTVVEVNGPVEGSLFIAGRTLALNSSVAGSVYVGGYAFTLGENATIGRNLNFGGFSLTAENGSEIGRSLYAAGYQILLHGATENDVNVGSAALELTGYVGGDVRGTVGSAEGNNTAYMPSFEGAISPVDPGLRVSNEAEIMGTLAVTVETVAEAPAPPPIYSLANSQLRWAIGETIALLIIGLLFLYLRPSFLERVGNAAQAQPLQSLGIGFLVTLVAIAAVPIIIGLLVALGFLTGVFTLGQLVGDVVGLGVITLIFAIALFVFTAGMLTKIIIAYSGGRLLLQQASEDSARRGPTAFLALAIGVIIYMVLRVIPVIGWLIGLIVTFVGLGAIYLTLRQRETPTMTASIATTSPLSTEPVHREIMPGMMPPETITDEGTNQ